MDGLGELTGAPGAAAEFGEDLQVLSWAFALSPGARSFACALLACFWESGLFFPLYGIFAYVLPWSPLSARVTSPAAHAVLLAPAGVEGPVRGDPVDRLLHVPPGSGRADLEPGREAA